MSDAFWRRYSQEQGKKLLLSEDKRLQNEQIQRRVFYSFHYENECRIAAQIKNIGSLPNEEKPVYGNRWETVRKDDEAPIKRWIRREMENRTCTIVLIGAETANRYWVRWEIIESWNRGMGVLGIHIHNLNDPLGGCFRQRWPSANPFETIPLDGLFGPRLAAVVQTFDPPGAPDTSQAYNWIADNLKKMVENAIEIRQGYPL